MARRKKRRRVNEGRVYVTATFNNTLVTVTDKKGNTVCWSSTGREGFKGSRKSTPFAATKAIQTVLDKARSYGMSKAKVFIKGPGPGRSAALRVLRNSDIDVTMIADVTPIPHNGCRPPKRRRV
jgi:small subunit ribosomal protein S11